MNQSYRTRRRLIWEIAGLCLAGPSALKAFAETGSNQTTRAPIRKRLANPYVENGKPVVVVVRGTEFEAMLSRGMELLGGFARFGMSKSVVVKPNFVFDKRTRYPVTTDATSVLTTVEFLQKEGFKDITEADRRGNRKNGRAGGKFDWSGLNDKAEEGGFSTDSLMDDAKAETVQVISKQWSQMPSYGVIQKIYEADLIINMPTLKRHSQTHLTCSMKNMMGVLDVPSTQNMHLWGDENKKAHDELGVDAVMRRLCLTVAEAAMAVSPEMTIIDARKVLCKDHVSYQTGEPRDANCLIISGDQVAADVCAAGVLKDVYEPYELGYTKETFDYAAKLGVGVADPNGFVVKEVSV
jgi:uncharacterized protein (DUF362 family)